MFPNEIIIVETGCVHYGCEFKLMLRLRSFLKRLDATAHGSYVMENDLMNKFQETFVCFYGIILNSCEMFVGFSKAQKCCELRIFFHNF